MMVPILPFVLIGIILAVIAVRFMKRQYNRNNSGPGGKVAHTVRGSGGDINQSAERGAR